MDPRLQSRLDPEEKYVKVANYQMGVEKDVATIAHSCGVAEPRQLSPHHVWIVSNDGPPRLLGDIHPGLGRRPSANPSPSPVN
jgi:hypothetical protein